MRGGTALDRVVFPQRSTAESEGSMRAESSTVAVAAGRVVAGAGSTYEEVGGPAGVQRIVAHFHQLVFDDTDLPRYFGADPADLRWHQAAQLTRVLGGPDWYVATGRSGVYRPLVVPAELYHRSAFYLVRAVDVEAGCRETVAVVASAVAAARCRIIGGFPVPGAVESLVVVSVEGTW